MADKIVVYKRIKYVSYFEITYLFILTVPVGMVGKDNPPLGATKEVYGTASYGLGTSAEAIKADLISKYNAAQNALNADTSLQYWGVTWDGSVWS